MRKHHRKNPHAVAMGRLGGRVMTPKKLAAVRRNAQRAGRKPKFEVGDRVRANDKAPRDYGDRPGTVSEIGPGRSEYGVSFTDGEAPRSGYLMSWWLDRSQNS